jgi:hypothetical protein
MAGYFTKIENYQDMQSKDILDELMLSVRERQLALYWVVNPVSASINAGQDIQSVSFWSTLQGAVNAMCSAFNPSSPYDTGGFIDEDYELEGSTAPTYFTTSALYTKAGIPSGFRRVEIGKKYPSDWTDYNDPSFTYGTIGIGDVIGPWLIVDLQKVLTILTTVSSYCGHLTYGYYFWNPAEYTPNVWVKSLGDNYISTSGANAVTTHINTDWPAGSWMNYGTGWWFQIWSRRNVDESGYGTVASMRANSKFGIYLPHGTPTFLPFKSKLYICPLDAGDGTNYYDFDSIFHASGLGYYKLFDDKTTATTDSAVIQTNPVMNPTTTTCPASMVPDSQNVTYGITWYDVVLNVQFQFTYDSTDY